jgi:CheY-like chemotaxis protein
MEITAPARSRQKAAGMPFTLLLIEQTSTNGTDYLSRLLGQFSPLPIDWIHVKSVGEALVLLSEAGVQGVLLDVKVSDGQVPEMISQICTAAPESPIVVLADDWDDAVARQVIQAGAQDYLLKGQTDAALLVRSLYMAVERKQGELAQEGLIHRLWRALSISGLAGGLEHMCMFCKKFRDEHGEWISVESYLQDRVGMEISHGMCQECGREQYPEPTKGVSNKKF